MSQKHFIAIAANIKTQVEGHRYAVQTSPNSPDAPLHDYAVKVLQTTAESLAYTFASFNGNFKRQRFLTACGF